MTWRTPGTAEIHDGPVCSRCSGTRYYKTGRCIACQRIYAARRGAKISETLRDAYQLRPRPIPPWQPPKLAPGLTLARLMAGK
jgi:hypothetical protein